MTRFGRFWYLTGREKLFFPEAYILLLISNIGVKTVAFSHINSYLHHWNERSRKAIVPPSDIKNDIRLIDVSISRAANAFPWNSLCLSRSIAKAQAVPRKCVCCTRYRNIDKPDIVLDITGGNDSFPAALVPMMQIAVDVAEGNCLHPYIRDEQQTVRFKKK